MTASRFSLSPLEVAELRALRRRAVEEEFLRLVSCFARDPECNQAASSAKQELTPGVTGSEQTWRALLDGKSFVFPRQLGFSGRPRRRLIRTFLHLALMPAALETMFRNPEKGLESLRSADLRDEADLGRFVFSPSPDVPDGISDEELVESRGLGMLAKPVFDAEAQLFVAAHPEEEPMVSVAIARYAALSELDDLVERVKRTGTFRSKADRKDLMKARLAIRRVIEHAYTAKGDPDLTTARVHTGCARALSFLNRVASRTGKPLKPARTLAVLGAIMTGKVMELARLPIGLRKDATDQDRYTRVRQALARYAKREQTR